MPPVQRILIYEKIVPIPGKLVTEAAYRVSIDDKQVVIQGLINGIRGWECMSSVTLPFSDMEGMVKAWQEYESQSQTNSINV